MNRWKIPAWLEQDVLSRDTHCVYCGVAFSVPAVTRGARPRGSTYSTTPGSLRTRTSSGAACPAREQRNAGPESVASLSLLQTERHHREHRRRVVRMLSRACRPGRRLDPSGCAYIGGADSNPGYRRERAIYRRTMGHRANKHYQGQEVRSRGKSPRRHPAVPHRYPYSHSRQPRNMGK